MSSSKWLRALVAIFIVLLPAATFAAPARPAPRNLLINPGFEKTLAGHDWMPAEWDTSDAALSTIFFGRDSLMSHAGKYSVNIANTSTVWPMSHNWSQTLLVGREAWGKDAVFSVWTRSSGLEGRAYILVQAYKDTVTRMARIWGVDRDEARRRMMITAMEDPNVNLGWKRVMFEDAETEWVRREARIHVPVGVNVLFVRCGLLGTGQVRYDDASLTLVPARPAPSYATGANVLEDPDYEGGGLPWEWAIPPFPGAKIARDSATAHAGRVSMRCSNMNEGKVSSRMGMCQPLSCRGLAGKRVRLSGWFKGDSLISKAYVKIYYDTQHGMEQSPAGDILSGTFDWTQSAIEMDVPDQAVVLWPWLVFNAPANGTVWLDDASLTVVGPALARRAPAGKAR